MRRILFLLGAALVLLGPVAFAGDGVELCIMSLNIRYGTADDGPNHWSMRKELVFGVLRDGGADVIGLQEALKFQLDEIAGAVPGFGCAGVGRDDGAEAGEFSAVLYREDRFDLTETGTFWFSATPDVPGSMSYGNRIPRICTWARLRDRESGLAFYVYNVHLDHESRPSRRASMEQLAAAIGARSPRDPVFVTGDFNAGEEEMSPLCGPRGEEGPLFVDTFRIIHPDAEHAGTFNAWRGERDGPKIDYVLATAPAEVLGAGIVRTDADGRYPSDHYPVWARVRVLSAQRERRSDPAGPDSGSGG